MNVYHELLELLCPRQETSCPVLFGTLSGVDPLQITVGETEIRQGLRHPRGMLFQKEDLGRELALLPCGNGFLILFQTEEGET